MLAFIIERRFMQLISQITYQRVGGLSHAPTAWCYDKTVRYTFYCCQSLLHVAIFHHFLQFLFLPFPSSIAHLHHNYCNNGGDRRDQCSSAGAALRARSFLCPPKDNLTCPSWPIAIKANQNLHSVREIKSLPAEPKFFRLAGIIRCCSGLTILEEPHYDGTARRGRGSLRHADPSAIQMFGFVSLPKFFFSIVTFWKQNCFVCAERKIFEHGICSEQGWFSF